MQQMTHGIAAVKCIKVLEKYAIDPLDKLAVLRTAASLLENEIAAATTKLLLRKSLEGE